MRTFDPRNVEITFGPAKFHDIARITRCDPPLTMPVKIVLKKQRRAVRQKFLAEEAKKRGVTIREVKKLWGNGSALTILNCTVTVERGSLEGKEWHFSSPDAGLVGSALMRDNS